MLEDNWIPCTYKTTQYTSEAGIDKTIVLWEEGRIVSFTCNSYGSFAVVVHNDGTFSSHNLYDVRLRVESD